VYWGPLYPSFVHIRELTRDPAHCLQQFVNERAGLQVSAAAVSLFADTPLQELEFLFESGVRTNMQAALTTFQAGVDALLHRAHRKSGRGDSAKTSNPSNNVHGILSNVTVSLIHDCKLRLEHDVQTALTLCMLPRLREKAADVLKVSVSSVVVVPCGIIVTTHFLHIFQAQLEDVLTSTSIPEALAPFLDAEGIVYDVLEDAAHRFVCDTLWKDAKVLLGRFDKLVRKWT